MYGPGPHPEYADPSSLLWCHEDNLFKRNFQFAKDSTVKDRKEFGLNFNPGPFAPRSDGTREANENKIGPFANFDRLLSHIAAQRAAVEQSAEEADSDDAPSPPKQKKKAKASKPSASAAPKASTKKSLTTTPPETIVQSEDLSRVSKRTKKPLPKKAIGNP